jgi:hypothetical protein
VERSRCQIETLSWICGTCLGAHPYDALVIPHGTHPIYSHIVSQFSFRIAFVGRFFNSVWARLFEFSCYCPSPRPAQLFITLWHTLYLCNIHPRQVSPPLSLSYPLLSSLLGMGTYLLPGDVDTEPPIGGLCRSLSLPSHASAPSTVIIARVVTIVQ